MDITMSISFILNNYVQEYPRHQCISSSSNIKFQKKKKYSIIISCLMFVKLNTIG